jgi:transcriptional regulator GlxA family with amidase domain
MTNATGMPPNDRPVVFLLFDDMEELDLAGPWELFSVWHDRFGGPPCMTVSASGHAVRARYGLQIVPDAALADGPEAGVLVVPGGDGSRRVAEDGVILGWVRQTAARAEHVLSICTGVRILHAAGLLDGRTVTTHHSALAEAAAWPGVTVREARYVRDGNVWTSAGVTAGMDLALAFIRAESGDATAQKVADFVEYPPR